MAEHKYQLPGRTPTLIEIISLTLKCAPHKPYDIAQGELGNYDVKFREKKFRGVYFLEKSSYPL